MREWVGCSNEHPTAQVEICCKDRLSQLQIRGSNKKCGPPDIAGISRIFFVFYYIGYFFIQSISSSMVVNARPVTVSAQP